MLMMMVVMVTNMMMVMNMMVTMMWLSGLLTDHVKLYGAGLLIHLKA